MVYLLTIPARNESRTIERVLTDFSAEAKRLGIDLDMQVVDDNSTDQTAQVVERLGVRVIRCEGGPGLANAFRTEMSAGLSTKADFFVHTDADGQYLAKDLEALIEPLSTGYDLVLGNRLHHQPPGMSEMRYEGNKMLSMVVSKLVRQNLADTQTGYRAFRRCVAENCAISGDYTYTQEQILRAGAAGYRICEVPIENRPRGAGTSRLMRTPFHYLSAVALDIEKIVAELYPESLNS